MEELKFLCQVPSVPGADHHPSRRGPGPAPLLPGQPAARLDGQAEEGGGAQVLLTPKPGSNSNCPNHDLLWGHFIGSNSDQ